MKTRLLLLSPILMVTLLFLPDTYGQIELPGSAQEEASQTEPDSVALQPFPASDITDAFSESGSMLNTARKQQLSPEQRAAFTSELDTLLTGINGFLDDSTTQLLVAVSSRELNQISLRAQYYTNQIESLQGRLSRVSTNLEDEATLLSDNSQRWQLTLKQSAETDLVASRLARIRRVSHRVDSVGTLLQNDLSFILDEQDNLSDKNAALEAVVSKVKEQKLVLGENILSRDMPGLLKDLPNLRDPNLIHTHLVQVQESVRSDVDLVQSGYLRSLIISLLLMVALLLLSVWFKKSYTRLISETEFTLTKLHLTIINSPVVSSFFITALIIRLLIPDLPQTFYAINLFILMIPMAILMIRIYGRMMRIWIIVLVVVSALNLLYELSYHPGVLLRILLVGLCFIGTWLFVRVYRRTPFSGLIKHPFVYKSFRVLVVVFIALQLLSIVANLIGAFQLAEFAALLPLQITFVAIAILLATKMGSTIIYLALASRYMQKLNVIRDGFQTIYRKSVWLLDFLLLFIFVTITLRVLRIKDLVFDWGKELLNDDIKIGDATITMGSILIFFFVIWLSITISKTISSILEKDLFTRVKTAKGIPGTVILLLRIALITGGFLLAATAAGMHMTNLSIVLGAFSVGIGFGLQNIFNNMVSGLILAFERPINVGDVVQVGELMGIVRTIGLRASTIKSFDGAEVIVPNGNLISNEMINWTLSDSYRRMDIRVGVAYGTNPEQVLEILLQIAGEHTGVRKKPAPMAYFIEFGDSSLNFRLLAWVLLDNRLEVQSEIHVLVNKKLDEAGIEIPFPQRDLHIRSDATSPPPEAPQAKPLAPKPPAPKPEQ